MKNHTCLLIVVLLLGNSVIAQIQFNQHQFITLTRTYGVIKYYNNQKDDSYLDNYAIEVLSKLEDPKYSAEEFNMDLQEILSESLDELKSNTETGNPVAQFEGTDHKQIINFSWIDENETLSGLNKKSLKRLINIHENVKNKNIRKKQIYFHEEHNISESANQKDQYLLGLIKYWNVIEYFFPYKPIMDEDWCEVFYDAIPGFPSIESESDYLLTLKKLTAKLCDSHAYVNDERINDTNVFKLPFSIEIVQNQLVVKSINDSLSNIYNIKTGDIIQEIDGKDYKQLWSDFTEVNSYSTPQAGRDHLKVFLFHQFNYNDSVVHICMKNEVNAKTIKMISLQDFIALRQKSTTSPSYKLVNDRTGYLRFPDMEYFELGKALRKIKKTEYLILDFRGHNYGFSSLRLLNFVGNRNIPIAKFYQPNLSNPGIFNDPKQVKLKILPKLRSTYKGKIIVLIDEKPVSAMESLLMAIKARRPEAVFIGSPTQGTDGQMSMMKLPGDAEVWFTGVGDWQYPDGSQFQRIGIHPDIHVDRTIESIINNQDMILNRAIDYIKNDAK